MVNFTFKIFILMQKFVLVLTLPLVWFSSMALAPAKTGYHYSTAFEEREALFSNTQQDTGKIGADSLPGKTLQQIYYNVPARLSTAATGTVYGPAITRLPVTSFAAALSGRVAGLFFLQNSGQPGAEGTALSLRGRTPIVLIDGIPRPLTVINLEEIESVTVLKDAMATAMLGSRAANGAILVTTKKGHNSKQQITANVQTSFQQPLQNLYSQPLHSLDYATLYNEAQANDNRYALTPQAPAYTASQLEGYRKGSDPFMYPDVNWQDQVFNNSSMFSKYSLTASGGSAHARYFVAGEYFNQTGLLKTSDQNTYNTNNGYKGYNIRSNVDVNITPKLTGGVYLLGRILNTNNPGNNNTAGIYSGILSTPNNAYPVLNRNGSFGGTRQYTNNILAQAQQAGYHQNTKRDILTDFYLKRDLDEILPGLWVKARASFTSHVSENVVRNKSFAVYQQNINADGSESYAQFGNDGTQANSNNVDTQNRMDYQELSLGYDRTFNNVHDLNILVLANRDNSVVNSNLPLTYTGISGYVAYHFKEKYLAEIAFGLNGSNRYPLAGDTRYGLFPTLGLGWNVSKENFLKDVNWISHLKLSATYGVTGWDNPGYFAYISRYGTSTSAVFGTAAGTQTTVDELAIGNPGISFEKTAKLNLALDGSFLKDRLFFRVDHYNDRVYDAVIQRGLNTTLLGQAYPDQNIGKYRYTGWEFELGWNQRSRPGFSYYIAANLSLQDSRVIDMAEVYQPYPWMRQTGRQIGQRFGYVAEGLFQSDADIAGAPTMAGYQPQPGDIRYKDQNGDQIIDQFDQVPIGPLKPQVFSGLAFGITLRSFDLHVLAQGAFNRQVSLSGNSFYEFQNNGLGQAYAHHLNRWTPENAAAADYPRLSLGNNINNHVPSTYWLRSGNFLRLRNVELGYNLPQSLIHRIRISSLRFFVSGTNLFTLASKDLNGADPEEFTGQYPLQKLTTLGVNIKL